VPPVIAVGRADPGHGPFCQTSEGEVIADDALEVLTVLPLFAPQAARLFPGRGWLVVEDALSGLGKG
jgi:hypothetical protein